MTKLFKLITAILFIVSFANATEFLKVGTAANYPPFEYIDNQNKITGFDIDLIDALSKKIGFKYEIVNMSFDGLIAGLKAGKINAIISAMSATPDRIKAIDFTNSYYNTENLFIKRKNSQITTKKDLINKGIGVQLGTVQEIAAKNISGAMVKPSENIGIAILALKANKVDVVLVDSSIGYGYLKKNPDLVEFLKEPDGSEGFSIAFDKNKNKNLIEKINKALLDLKQDGTYEKLLKKYDLK